MELLLKKIEKDIEKMPEVADYVIDIIDIDTDNGVNTTYDNYIESANRLLYVFERKAKTGTTADLRSFAKFCRSYDNRVNHSIEKFITPLHYSNDFEILKIAIVNLINK